MSLVQTLGWTLIHSTWEITGIALLFAIVSVLARSASARTRYVFALVALALCVISPIVTFVKVQGPPSTHFIKTQTSAVQPLSLVSKLRRVGAAPPARVLRPLSLRPDPPPVNRTLSNQVEPLLPGLVVVWLVGIAFLSIRFIGGLFSLQRLKSRSSDQIERRWEQLIAILGKSVGVDRPILLRLSSEIQSPAVLGFIKVIVLFPVSALITLSPQQVEALLAHEIAHIRRHDYLVNLIQSLVEIVLFYHPAVWWISHVVRSEREHCCDDLAVELLGDREVYAQALFELESLRSAPPLVVAANHSSLRHRIRRILMRSETQAVDISAWVPLTLAVVVACLGFAQSLHAKQPTAPITDFHGRVLTSSGQPAKGATVQCQSYGPDRDLLRVDTVTADSSGKFKFPIKVGDRWTIVAFQQGRGVAADRENRPSEIALRFATPATYPFRVIGVDQKPCRGEKVGMTSLRFADGTTVLPTPELQRFITRKTDESGNVILEGLPVGGLLIPDVLDNRFARSSWELARCFRVSATNSVGSLVLEPACEIDGKVSRDGSPVPNALVGGSGEGASVAFSVRTNAQGRFRLTRLRSVKYNLHAGLPLPISKSYRVADQSVTPNSHNVVQVELKLTPLPHYSPKPKSLRKSRGPT